MLAFLTLACCRGDVVVESQPALLPSEGTPASQVSEPLRTPIPPPGYDPAQAQPLQLTAAEQREVDEANRLSDARAREAAGSTP